ncbi:helix-turn-helix transcriptional regulator [Planomonospora sp. ID67723]|uniref:helix-turn-helix domain-containing protein n=1 Tax=Planomonospora sp. ID67723 TaxID=2738134 RepID=UPI0027DE21B9|nr:helix-turn-helix transcriptional regulator [Planomonospora sp. ID67723]
MVLVRPGRRKREVSRYADQAARLSAQLRALREQAGMTQLELAIRAEVSESTVRKIEQGQVIEPGFFLVMALLKALGTTPAALD